MTDDQQYLRLQRMEDAIAQLLEAGMPKDEVKERAVEFVDDFDEDEDLL